MANSSARGIRTYLKLKGKNKAKDYQKIRLEEWLDENLKNVCIKAK